MKFNSYLTLVLVCFAALLTAQREVFIESTAIDIISSTIEADLLATDTATVESTIYRLRRGTNYAYATQFQPGYKLTIMAEEGDGTRPRIVAVPPSEGQAPRFIRPEATDLTLMSLDIEQKDAVGEHTDNAPVRPRGQSARIWVEDCVFDGQRFEVVRTDADSLKVYLINNIIRNNYEQNLWFKSGGYYFQRGNYVDTLVMRHNTYFNTTGRMTHEVNGAVINYWDFRYNTVVNVGGMRELPGYNSVNGTAPFDMGFTRNLIVENNLFYNMGFFGADAEVDSLVGVFNYNKPPDTLGGLETFVFRNNNIYTDPLLLEGTPDTAIQFPLVSLSLDTFLRQEFGATSGEDWVRENNISEELTFANAPMSIDIFRQAKAARWADPETAGQTLLLLDDSIDEYALDFSYSRDAASFSGGTDGNFMGSGRWFPDVMVATEDYDLNRSQLDLQPNFPNPVRTYTTLRMNLAAPATLEVTIFDINGRTVFHRAGERLGAGQDQQLVIDGLDLPAGTYQYTVIADMAGRRYGATRRMIVQ